MTAIPLFFYTVSWALLFLVCLASTARADAPQLRISITDGDPLDAIRILNTGDCTVATGLLILDMSQSAGRIVIDTEYGGLGTRDPSPISVNMGPLVLEPVADGDTSLVIRIGGLGPNSLGIITFDADTQRSFWADRRVIFEPGDLAGTTARFVTLGETREVFFGAGGSVRLDLPEAACDPSEPLPPVPSSPADSTPIS